MCAKKSDVFIFFIEPLAEKCEISVFPLVNPCIVSGRLLLFSSPQLVHVQKHRHSHIMEKLN